MSRTSTVLRPDPFARGHVNPLRSNPVFVEEYPPHVQANLRPRPVRVDNPVGLEDPFVSSKGKGPQTNLPKSSAPRANASVIGQAVTTSEGPGPAASRAAFITPTRNNLVVADPANSSEIPVLKVFTHAHSSRGFQFSLLT
jgi:hypothetical protein